ncbi:MAG: sugar phosphate nucleotidyltransferase [Sandaracinaceae bacterium]|nr:MAG: glucose-1-phosphate adenylyltransferase [Sandaracinaceae bacterium]HBQ20048.1 glucose-1-phosphate adenylyltransferase [Myxococcales bacterium]
MKKVLAIILAGGEGSRLGILTAKRTKPAVPFAGKYRIIDFALSNCVNSGLFDVMIVAQYRPHSLIEHIGGGGPWDLNRERWGGVRIYTPYRSRELADWFVGTADAVQQNFLFIKDRRPDLVLVLSGDHIYRMNYRHFIDAHVESGAAVTLATIPVTPEEAPRFGIVGTNDGGWATSFVEKPKEPPPGMGSMGVYVFNYDVLDRVLIEDHHREGSAHDFGKDILPKMIGDGEKVFTWPYHGYWRDVGTLDSYWDAHMDLLAQPPAYDLNDVGWLIHTRSENRAPARLGKATIVDSLVCDGCVIDVDAVVERSVLGPGVRVRKGAVIRDSIVQNDSWIGDGAVVERAIIDKGVHLGHGVRVGQGGDSPLAVVGKGATLPDGFVVHPGGEVAHDVVPEDLETNEVPSGLCVHTKRRPWQIPGR